MQQARSNLEMNLVQIVQSPTSCTLRQSLDILVPRSQVEPGNEVLWAAASPRCKISEIVQSPTFKLTPI